MAATCNKILPLTGILCAITCAAVVWFSGHNLFAVCLVFATIVLYTIASARSSAALRKKALLACNERNRIAEKAVSTAICCDITTASSLEGIRRINGILTDAIEKLIVIFSTIEVKTLEQHESSACLLPQSNTHTEVIRLSLENLASQAENAVSKPARGQLEKMLMDIHTLLVVTNKHNGDVVRAGEQLTTLTRQIGDEVADAVTALQFHDMASQLCSNIEQNLVNLQRSAARLASSVEAGKNNSAGGGEGAGLHSPVTQDCMRSGEVELFDKTPTTTEKEKG